MRVSTPSKRLIVRRLIVLFLCVALGWFLKGRMTPGGAGMGAAGGMPYVLVQAVESKEVAQAKNQIAHVEAINSVDLLSQVSGTVDEVLFKEGSFVKEGDVLFVIDPNRYKATLNLREAELASAKANLTEAERNYNRQIKLSKQNIASKATFDAAESTFLRAKASVKQAEANLDLAKIDMEYTRVKAPISGYIGKALVTKGNYASATAQVLARIVQVSPVRVTFSLTDKEFLLLKKQYEAGEGEVMKARITLPDGTVMVEDFTSRFVDNEVSTKTATVSIYSDFANTDEKLLPGNYVQIALVREHPQMSVMIPQASLAQDEHGFYTFVVNDDDVVEERRLVLGEVVGSQQVVLEGLNEGERVIIQGLQRVQNGVKVRTGFIQAQ